MSNSFSSPLPFLSQHFSVQIAAVLKCFGRRKTLRASAARLWLEAMSRCFFPIEGRFFMGIFHASFHVVLLIESARKAPTQRLAGGAALAPLPLLEDAIRRPLLTPNDASLKSISEPATLASQLFGSAVECFVRRNVLKLSLNSQSWAGASTVGRGADCHVRLIQGSWFGIFHRITNSSSHQESVKWYKPCLGRIKHWLFIDWPPQTFLKVKYCILNIP